MYLPGRGRRDGGCNRSRRRRCGLTDGGGSPRAGHLAGAGVWLTNNAELELELLIDRLLRLALLPTAASRIETRGLMRTRKQPSRLQEVVSRFAYGHHWRET